MTDTTTQSMTKPTAESTTFSLNLTAVQMLEIEDRARQLRAEAIRYGFNTCRDWVKARFAALFAGTGQRA